MLTTWEEKAMGKGKVEGKTEGKIKIAKKLLTINMSVEQIAQITELSGSYNPSLQFLKKIAKGLGKDLSISFK